LAVVGEHGADAGDQSTPPAVLRTVERWASDLLADLGGHPGIAIEVKRWSLAIHYRAAPDPGRAAALVRAAAARLPAARVFGGAAVVNVVPAGAPDKGTAVATLARSVGARSVLYVGDDDTDEDAFRSPAVTVAVRVGRTPLSSARWVLDEQREMDLLLGALVRARSRRTLGDGRPTSPLTPLQEDGP
jgi:trehalose 6-phosphate phosphatase